jgi:hypothetical protein
MMRDELLTVRGEVILMHVLGGGPKPEEDAMRCVSVGFC